MPRKTLTTTFTRCVKSVGRTKPEGVAIAICTKTVLFPRKKTIKSFKMVKGKPKLVTQKRKNL